MAFMLGAFTGGLASGAKNAMDLYGQYQDLKSKDDLKESMTKAMDERNHPKAGVQPGQATAGVQTGPASPGSLNSYGDGEAMSGSSAAPKPAPDPNADPRKPSASRALSAFGDGLATMPNPPQAQAQPQSQPQSQPQPVSNPQFEAGRSTSPANMTTYDQLGAPQPSVYSAAPTGSPSGGSIFGSKVSDWLAGRTTFGGVPIIRADPGPIREKPSPEQQQGVVHSYLPAQNQPGQNQPAPRPPAMSGAPGPRSPSLANQMSPIGQAVQTQYGNGGA